MSITIFYIKYSIYSCKMNFIHYYHKLCFTFQPQHIGSLFYNQHKAINVSRFNELMFHTFLIYILGYHVSRETLSCILYYYSGKMFHVKHLDLNKVVFDGKNSCLCSVCNINFLKNTNHMIFNSTFTYIKMKCNIPIKVSICYFN